MPANVTEFRPREQIGALHFPIRTLSMDKVVAIRGLPLAREDHAGTALQVHLSVS